MESAIDETVASFERLDVSGFRYLVRARIAGQPDHCGPRIVRIDRSRAHHDTKEQALAFARSLGDMWRDPWVITQYPDGRIYSEEPAGSN